MKPEEKIKQASDEELNIIWDSLRFYNSWEMYSETMSMDEWAELVKSELDRRGRDK